jgi:RNA polymerase sigma-70 factor (ECF subfamily)
MAIYIDDRELVAAHQAGDGEAFDELVREHRRSLLSHAKNKLHCDAASEDALQETLVRAYKALPRFNGEYRLGPWLHRIMSNVCIDEANRRKRDGDKTDQYAAQRTFRDEMPSVEDELGLHIDDSALKAALDGLSEPYRQALELKFVQEYDYSQLAAVSGVSEANARARVSRARLAIRSAMKGVAVFPALLFGLFRRGEKAAAAATSGGVIAAGTGSTAATVGAQTVSVTSTMSAIAEASTLVAQAAPQAVPIVAKAAVGLGLAAAVLTPTSDSAVHQAVQNFATSPAGIVEIDASERENPIGLENGLQLTEPLGATVSDSKREVVQSLELMGSDESISPDGIGLHVENLSVATAGPGRYDLSGGLELVFQDGSVVEATLRDVSRIAIEVDADPDDRRRVDGLLVLSFSTGEELELRLAGFALGSEADIRLAGLFRSVGDTNWVPERGSFNGTMVVMPDSSTSVLAFTLTP